jgi:gluconolactonase
MGDTIAIASSSLLRLAETDAHEGPVYAADEDALYFTTVRRERIAIKRLELPTGCISTLREDANTANGMTLDREGQLIVCEQGSLSEPARISRIDRSTGKSETLVEGFNSPNDVVVASDGAIWFSDPSYGYLQGFRARPELPDAVYRYEPGSDELAVVADSLDKPNGLAFSPDESVLYVGDNGAPHHLLAFDVDGGVRLRNGRIVAVSTPEHPDGIKVDSEGRVYASFAGGIQIFDPSGNVLGEIALPGAVNFTFGGVEGNQLFITTDTAVWAAVLDAKGA